MAPSSPLLATSGTVAYGWGDCATLSEIGPQERERVIRESAGEWLGRNPGRVSSKTESSDTASDLFWSPRLPDHRRVVKWPDDTRIVVGIPARSEIFASLSDNQKSQMSSILDHLEIKLGVQVSVEQGLTGRTNLVIANVKKRSRLRTFRASRRKDRGEITLATAYVKYKDDMECEWATGYDRSYRIRFASIYLFKDTWDTGVETAGLAFGSEDQCISDGLMWAFGYMSTKPAPREFARIATSQYWHLMYDEKVKAGMTESDIVPIIEKQVEKDLDPAKCR